MRDCLRAQFCHVFFSITAAVLSLPGSLPAQTQEKAAEAPQAQASSGPAKPVHKSDWVITNDSIVRLTAQRDQGMAETTTKDATKNKPATGKELPTTAEDPTKRSMEIADLEKQIQEKQKRIALLMRLFVRDEQPFIRDPLGAQTDRPAQDRRKYEQDELLYESAEIARLRTRLEQLKAAQTP
jgi:hypothetical protein